MNPNNIFFALTSIILILVTTDGYKVLYLASIPSPSHSILGQAYVRELVKRGHQVTYLSPFPMKDASPNVSQIDIGFIMDTLSPELQSFDILKKQTDSNILHDWIKILENVTRLALEHRSVQTFIDDKTQSFDLVVVDWLYNELFTGFAALYQCPLVYSSSLDVHSGILSLVDEVGNPAYTDDVMVTYPKPYTFLQRVEMLWALLGNLYLEQTLRRGTAADYDRIFSKAALSRGITLPPYEDVIYNASLLLTNSHPSYASSTKLPQNVKLVGGYYIEVPTNPLPAELQKIMDESKHGVIYLSFGTNAQAKNMPLKMRTELIKMLAGLKQTVLWKFEEELPNLPKNIITRKWLPQSSILAHPNMKVFITHGGMLSTTETVHYGVPIICVPLTGDQFLNAKRAVAKGFAVKVKLSDNLADDLKTALDEIYTNPSYAATAKRLSSLYHDRPLPPAEELVYWLEYAVRTGGAPHLRSAALLLPWYQRLYVDLLALIVVTLLGLLLLVKYIWNCCKGKQNQVKKKTN